MLDTERYKTTWIKAIKRLIFFLSVLLNEVRTNRSIQAGSFDPFKVAKFALWIWLKNSKMFLKHLFLNIL